MPRGVGIEITDQRVRVAVVDANAKKVRLVGFGEAPITVEKDQDPAVAATEAVRKAMVEAKAPRGRVAASVDSGEAIVRELALPFKQEDQLRKTVTFELESQLHVAIDDLVVDFFKTGETEGGASVLAVAVPKKSITSKLKVLEAAGIDPVAVDLDMAALFAAYEKTGAVTQDEPFLVVYGTTRFTKILLIDAKKPRSLRTIRFTFPSKEEIAREADERKKAASWQTRDHPEPAPIVILGEKEQQQFQELDTQHRSALIDILGKEVQRFLLASAASSSPTHILLAGDYDNPEAAEMLSSVLAIPVRTHDPLAAAEPPAGLASAAGRVAVPMGLALKACEIDPLGLDFRKSEFTYAKKFDVLKTTGLVTLELLIVLLAAVALHFHFEYERLKAYRDEMWQHQAELLRDATNVELAQEDWHRAFPDMEKAYKEVLANTGGGDHPIERSALDLANQFFRSVYNFGEKFQSKSLGTEKLYLMLESLRITQNTTPGSESIELQVSGTIANLEYITALKQEIRGVDPFRDAKWDVQESTGIVLPDGKRKFNVTIRKAKKPS